MSYTLQHTSNWVKEQLKSIYPSRETEQFLFLIYEKLFQLSRIQVMANPDTKISNSDYNQMVVITNRLRNHEPIQYILGETEFYELTFEVNSAVLIPRPETEELVDWIIKENKNTKANILDIGTGSGCIAIALKKNLPEALVKAMDVSEKALEVARQNALNNQVSVDFILSDILNQEMPKANKSWDIVVSNPPYVTQSEKKLMQRNVLDFEPDLALFVEDTDPLLFYRTIALKAKTNLQKQGFLYFEINEALGNELSIMLENLGYKNIELRADIHGKHRMVKAQNA